MKTIPLADEVDLECEPPDDANCVEVGVDGLWYVDADRLSSFADRLAELINEYKV
jgi:hypothetical protein